MTPLDASIGSGSWFISGAGDGCVRVWDGMAGTCLTCLDTRSVIPSTATPIDIVAEAPQYLPLIAGDDPFYTVSLAWVVKHRGFVVSYRLNVVSGGMFLFTIHAGMCFVCLA